MSELFTLPVLLGILYSGVRLATPYLYAAIGEMFAQRSGVLNLGVEGIMLMGAYTAFFVAMSTHNLWLGLLAACLVGMLMGLLMAFVSVTLQAEQGISGIGLHLFGLGLSSLLFKKTLGSVESISGFQSVKIPLLGDLPLVGEVFFNHNLLVYGAFLLVPVAWFYINRTRFGLHLRAVGENPTAADAVANKIEKNLELLSGNPNLGRIPREEEIRSLGYRYLIVQNYLIFYTIEERTIFVHKILHGARNYKTLL